MAESQTFREYLPDLAAPRFTRIAECDAYSHAAELVDHQRPPWLYALYQHWLKLLKEPFRGVTNDGHVRPGLFEPRDEGVPVADIVQAANKVLGQLTDDQRQKTQFHIDSPQWRTWSNPEFLLSDKGVRLDQLAPALRADVLAVLEAALSPEGYAKAVAAMRVNHFLGALVGAPAVMNEFSYNFCVFGEPDAQGEPWGFSFYGHHLCLSVFLRGPQIVVSPWFTGAEPNLIDDGPYKGTRILHEEERLGLQLMQSLAPEHQAAARTYEQMKDDKMPKGRWNHDDQRHLLGAYRDNRVVPYEGVVVASLPAEQQEILKLDDCRAWYHETYFSWIGGYGAADPFYFRIQSPVVVVEFDHHSGVFLTNQEPKRFHIHTLLRTPNGGDYGFALRGMKREGEVNQEFVWEG
ncbi:hypothetical protein PG984_001457 [Apiospora sp. TS-2023a]